MQFRSFVRTAHRWLALALGALFALWAASGFALAVIPKALTRGESAQILDVSPDLEARSYASPGGIIAQMGRVSEIKLKRGLGRVVYEAHGPDGAAVFDARTAERLSPINEDAARIIATQDFAGAEAIRRAQRAKAENGAAVWRVEFKDQRRTAIFVSIETGEVVGRRNSYSSLYGLFRSIHFLDFSGAGRSDNLLLKAMALLAFAFASTGLCLVALRLKDGRFGFRRIFNAQEGAGVKSAPPEAPAPDLTQP